MTKFTDKALLDILEEAKGKPLNVKDPLMIGMIDGSALYVFGDETIEVITPDSYTIETNRPSFFKEIDND